jgi:hypothetical protein
MICEWLRQQHISVCNHYICTHNVINSGMFETIWPFSFNQGNNSNHGNLDIHHPVTSESRNTCRSSKHVHRNIVRNDNVFVYSIIFESVCICEVNCFLLFFMEDDSSHHTNYPVIDTPTGTLFKYSHNNATMGRRVSKWASFSSRYLENRITWFRSTCCTNKLIRKQTQYSCFNCFFLFCPPCLKSQYQCDSNEQRTAADYWARFASFHFYVPLLNRYIPLISGSMYIRAEIVIERNVIYGIR